MSAAAVLTGVVVGALAAVVSLRFPRADRPVFVVLVAAGVWLLLAARGCGA